MNTNERLNITPKEHIMDLFENTKDSIVYITLYDEFEAPHQVPYGVDWTKNDALALTQSYKTLTTMLEKFGKLHDELLNENKRKELLTPEELSVWETYILPYDLSGFDMDKICELFDRCLDYDLNDEEDKILENYIDWINKQSLKRLPFIRKSPLYVINRARRYEELVHLKAPEIILRSEGRSLAEEMILYYHFDKNVKIENKLDDIIKASIETKE